MAFATIDDLLEVEPNIQEYGLLDFEAALALAEADIIKLLKIRWWPSYVRSQPTLKSSSELDSSLLNPSQWTNVTCYYALAHFILPKMTKFESDTDSFQHKMEYYGQRAESAFDIEARSGVLYDLNDNNTFDSTENNAVTSLRLKR
jgi:hypothetical protein